MNEEKSKIEAKIEKLIGKKLKNVLVKEDEISIETYCKQKIRFGVKEVYNDLTEFVDIPYKIHRDKEKFPKIESLDFSNQGLVIKLENKVFLRVKVKGVREIKSVNIENNGKEVLIQVVGYGNVGYMNFLYFKTEDGWKYSKFSHRLRLMYEEQYEIAEKYDLIHHPSVRLLAII